jgi:predicted transcriptional regulator
MTGWQKNMTLVRVLAEQGKSAHEIGELINVTQNTVQRYAKAEGIQLAPSINVGKKEKKIYCKTPTPEKLALAERYKAMYIAGKTLHEIGVEEGVSRERIRQILSVIGVDRSLSGYSARVKSRKEAKLQEKIEETVRKRLGIYRAARDRQKQVCNVSQE